MTIKQVKEDLKWRIKDLEKTYNFWLDQEVNLPTLNREEQMLHEYTLNKMRDKDSSYWATLKISERFDLQKAYRKVEEVRKQKSEAQYHSLVSLIRMDVLQRVLESIEEVEQEEKEARNNAKNE